MTTAKVDGRKGNTGGPRGPIAELKRQIGFQQTMAQRVLVTAQAKSEEYLRKAEALKVELAEAEAAEESDKL